MCCNNLKRERWVTSLVLLALIFSLAVAIPMILITYPGDECLLFVSVRGEALIYGHPAGCRFIAGSHILVCVASLVFLILFLVWKRRTRARGSNSNTSASNKTLQGSLATATSYNPRTKPSVALLLLALVIAMFAAITAIIILSGYMVTCGELQYETRRQVHDSVTLGIPFKNVFITCFSLFRDQDFRTRFQFDHYELAGQWHGQYTAYRHGRPHVWTGSGEHLLDAPTGLEMALAASWISWGLWSAVVLLMVLHRRSVKRKNREEIAESVEDARIWASDMESMQAAGLSKPTNPVHQYEMVNKGGGIINYEGVQVPGPPSDASDVDTLLAHQMVVASSHPEGSYFMTSNGTYVQLVNGVLTNVDIQPTTIQPVQYSELQFPQQQQPQHQQMLQQQQILQQQMLQQQMLQQQMMQQQPYMSLGPLPSMTQSPDQPLGLNNQRQNVVSQSQSPEGSVTSSQLSQAATVSHMSGSSTKEEMASTRSNMRRQKEIADMAGIKCSQF